MRTCLLPYLKPIKHISTPCCHGSQRIDYRKASSARAYADAWLVSDVQLSCKEDGEFDFARQYPTGLFFVAGPNAGTTGRNSRSTVRRTYNTHAATSYPFFQECVRQALYAGLHAMAHSGYDTVLLAFVSGGLYAGQWASRQHLLNDYCRLVQSVLDDTSEQPAPLSYYFQKVVLTILK